MDGKTAFIFPAFITSFTLKELDILKNNGFDLNHYIKMASDIMENELPDFSYDSGFYQNNELYSQIIAYIFSCAFNDLLVKKDIQPDYVAGYSMGIYASLYSIGAIRFEYGIRIISEVFHLVSELSFSGEYGMGAIIGLLYNDVLEQVEKHKLQIEIININNNRSLVVAGIKNDVLRLLEIVRAEGAFSAAELTVQTPYHSKYLKSFKDPLISFLKGLKIIKAKIPVVSTFDQREIVMSSEIKDELVCNLTQKINWYKTMQKLLEKNVVVFYECGAGKDLSKIARFIEGNYEIKSVYKI